MRTLETATDVFEELGGIDAVAKLTNSGYRAAHNWKAAGLFPAKTYVAIVEELGRRGASVPPALFGMVGESAQ